MKTKLKMTGTEMFTFVKLFGVLIGDLIDEDNEYCHLYFYLHDIVSIIQAKSLAPDIADHFAFIIKEHHELYMKLTSLKLKPKHHFLTHYPKFLVRAGPYVHYFSIRPEAKHKVLKAISNVVLCRK